MPQGLQIWSASGALILDTQYFLGRVLGSIDTGLSNGSVTNSELASGDPFWFVYPLGISTASVVPALVSVVGSQLSWTFESAPRLTKIVYGVR